MRDSSRVTVSVFAVAAFLFGLASLALAMPFAWKQYQVIRNWPVANATVRNSAVVQVTQGGEKLWSTRFELSFDAGSHLVVTTVNGYRQGFRREEVEDSATRFPKGAQVVVRYDPKNPAEVRLDTDKPRRYYQLPLALSITGVIFIVIALGMFYVTKL